ncbi:MAG TPA: NHL repeat-containing protein [Bacteroidales bacterium]|nr:NHL repeat-containing protein [Bacteroidales bacterium]
MKTQLFILLIPLAFLACKPKTSQLVIVEGERDTSLLCEPFGICADAKGNIYIADVGKNCIKCLKTGEEITVFAGTGEEGNIDGDRKTATFSAPSGVCFDHSGNMYIAGFGGENIRKITPDGIVSTVAGTGEEGYADGPADKARFSSPRGICIDSKGNLYVGDCWNHRIRKIDTNGIVTTFAGGGKTGELVVNAWRDGADTTARFDAPCGVAADKNDNIYVADANNSCIRRITPDGYVTTIAGKGRETGLVDGPAGVSRLFVPTELTVSGENEIFFSDTYNHCIRKIDKNGIVSTLAGTGQKGFSSGLPRESLLSSPRGICICKGELYFAEWGNHTIRKLTLSK